MRPQLAEAITDPSKYLNDPDWAITQKLDGDRCLIVKDEENITAYGRDGAVRNIPAGVRQTISQLDGPWVFDGELVGLEYWVFDLLHTPATWSIETAPWSMRTRILDNLFNGVALPFLAMVPWHIENKEAFFNQCSDANNEGVVFKDINAPYVEGSKRHWKKYKFLNTVDCVVIDVGVDGKDNIVLGVYKDGQIKPCGKVSALQGDGPKIQKGMVIEVQCLYATAKGRLYQTKLPKIRTDKQPEECTYDQIELCQTNKAVTQ